MTTSGATTGLLTAREIIIMAGELIGLVSAGEALEAEVGASAMRHLNWMLKSWQARTDNLSRIDTFSMTWPSGDEELTFVTTTPGAGQIQVAQNYLDVRNVYRRIDSSDLILTRLSLSDYAALPNKASTGTPLTYSMVYTDSTLKMRVWPVPADDTTIKADGVRVIEDVTTLTQTIDLRQEWTETVVYGLAKRLMAVYPAASIGQANDVRGQADALYASLMAYDQEGGSVFLQPAFGMGFSTGPGGG